MGILVDWQIRQLCVEEECQKEKVRLKDLGGWTDDRVGDMVFVPLLDPYFEGVYGEQKGTISAGLTSAGYDLRLADEIFAFKSAHGEWVDPKRFSEEGYKERFLEPMPVSQDGTGKFFPIPTNGCVLGRSLEYIRVPRGLKGHCLGKSTYARVHVFPNITPLEPGWEGHLTLEISNIGPNTVKVYVGEGVCQLELHRLDANVEKDYQQKGGKYNYQTGVTPARVL